MHEGEILTLCGPPLTLKWFDLAQMCFSISCFFFLAWFPLYFNNEHSQVHTPHMLTKMGMYHNHVIFDHEVPVGHI